MCKKLVSTAITIVAVSIHIFAAQAPTAVEIHGALGVEGNRIVDQNGKPTQLRGMSFFWSQWMDKYYNNRVVKWLVKDWKVTIVRAAMGVKHDDSETGYLYDGSERYKVETIVNAAIEKGVYVIIDWHDHHAHEHTERAVSFFEMMAKKYGDHPNVIYEIYNEPIKASWSDDVKPYAETVVAAIRAIDPDNLIVIGSPSWCQDVDEPAKDPVEGENLAYSLHFYAATHGADLRDKAQFALDQGLALFATEFGTCLASGDGFLDSLGTMQWFEFLDENKISWCNWSIADKDETASALIPGARWYGKWKHRELTPSGRIIRRKLRMDAGFEDDTPPPEKKKKKDTWLKIKPLR
ncbi:MAG: glycoside hydrolase family 5 protein [Chitinivibrionales bacterium]